MWRPSPWTPPWVAAYAAGLYRSFQVISGIHRLAVQGGFQMDVGVHAHLGQSGGAYGAQRPVQGTILRDYSVETLSLDPTLGDWRTHGGLDIRGPQLR